MPSTSDTASPGGGSCNGGSIELRSANFSSAEYVEKVSSASNASASCGTSSRTSETTPHSPVKSYWNMGWSVARISASVKLLVTGVVSGSGVAVGKIPKSSERARRRSGHVGDPPGMHAHSSDGTS